MYLQKEEFKTNTGENHVKTQVKCHLQAKDTRRWERGKEQPYPIQFPESANSSRSSETSSLKNHKAIHFWCLSHLAYGTLEKGPRAQFLFPLPFSPGFHDFQPSSFSSSLSQIQTSFSDGVTQPPHLKGQFPGKTCCVPPTNQAPKASEPPITNWGQRQADWMVLEQCLLLFSLWFIFVT